jgi:hypothetical protein
VRIPPEGILSRVRELIGDIVAHAWEIIEGLVPSHQESGGRFLRVPRSGPDNI